METAQRPQRQPARTVDSLDLANLERGRSHNLLVRLVQNGVGRNVRLPVMVVHGAEEGPVLGLTAAVHGNELNGIPIIHKLMATLEPEGLTGTVVAVPVVNLPGYLDNSRRYRDGQDLNRVMPGKEPGSESELYAHRFMTRVVHCFDYLVDLHTASFGRANSLYVRVDLGQPVAARLAHCIGAQIIVHNEGADGTLRSAASDLGIHAITVEVGDPNRFQRGLIRSSRLGLLNVLQELGMIEVAADEFEDDAVVCARSYWLYTDVGGVLEVFPRVASFVETGEIVARVTDTFGEVVRKYTAPEGGIVVGKSSNPVAHGGSRILHLGIPV